jgi:Ca-activated chloride channel family protein
VKLRYKTPDGDTSRRLSTTMGSRPGPVTANFGFASAVAEFGMLLGGSKHAGSADFAGAVARAAKFRGVDSEGYRGEFIELAELAPSLRGFEAAKR